MPPRQPGRPESGTTRSKHSPEETPNQNKRLQEKEGDTACVIVFNVYYGPVFLESLLELGVSPGEFVWGPLAHPEITFRTPNPREALRTYVVFVDQILGIRIAGGDGPDGRDRRSYRDIYIYIYIYIYIEREREIIMYIYIYVCIYIYIYIHTYREI